MKTSNTFRDLLCACVWVALACRPAAAVDPSRAVSQYVRDHWGAEQGFPRGPVYAIAQTPDGYLWIGTEAGLVRFDGQNFQIIRDKSGRVTSVLGLVADTDGNLWVRMPGPTLLRYRDGIFEDAMTALGMPFSNVTTVCRSRDGSLLLSRLEDGAVAYRKGKFEVIRAVTPPARSPIISFAETGNGDIWMGTRDAGLFRVSGSKVTAVQRSLPDTKINSLLSVGDHELWVGTDNGVAYWNGSELSSGAVPAAMNHFQALALLRDRDANIWVGTNERGLLRVNSRGAMAMDDGAGAVTALFEDREGNIWIGRADGIERLRDSAFVTYSTTEGVPTDGSNPLYVDAQQRVWFPPASGGLWWMRQDRFAPAAEAWLKGDIVYALDGRNGSLWLGRQQGGLTELRIDNGVTHVNTYRRANGLAQDAIYSVLVAKDGSVWAGTPSGGVSHVQQGRITNYTTADGLISNTVVSILEAADRSVWFATPVGLSVYADGRWKSMRAKDGLPSANVNCLLQDSSGVIWAGTTNGVAHQSGDRFVAAASASPLLHEPILGMAEDQFHFFWMSTSNRVLRVHRDKLLRGGLKEEEMREFGVADGLRSSIGVKRHRSVMADAAGRIWLSMDRGISVVDPARLTGSEPTIVQIQSVSADGAQLDIRQAGQISGGKQRITFGYAGLSLSVPERVRFRYALDGFDHELSEPVAAREAVYTNLGPGKYRFHVIASNADGAWNGAEAALDFEILPFFWQTRWFQISTVLVLILAAIGAYRLRLRSLTRQLNVRFEERLAERTRIAQELHDTLLQGFLSASMQLHVATGKLADESPEKTGLDRVLGLMRQVIEEGRNAVRGLRAVDSGSRDLAHAFSRIQYEVGTTDNVDFRVVVDGEPRKLHPILRDEVYRVGREALVNAFRHSKAANIEMEIEYSARKFRMLIRDNGVGIEPGVLQSGREGHWGLRGMRERTERIGGQLHLYSSAPAGTEVELVVPANIAYQHDPADRPPWWRRWKRGETKAKDKG